MIIKENDYGMCNAIFPANFEGKIISETPLLCRSDWRKKTLIAVVRFIPNSLYKLSHCFLISLSSLIKGRNTTREK